jgi:Tfp pilus assembly major pilin PilA
MAISRDLGLRLIEFMIVLTIFGTLAKIATPANQNYWIRAGGTEVLSLAVPQKALLAEVAPSGVRVGSRGYAAGFAAPTNSRSVVDAGLAAAVESGFMIVSLSTSAVPPPANALFLVFSTRAAAAFAAANCAIPGTFTPTQDSTR